jgi:DNA-binding transcriptional regulator YiaG
MNTAPMSNIEFLQLQARLNMKNTDVADFFNVTKDSVHKWRSGRQRIKGPVAIAMRLLAKYPHEAERE